MSILSQLLENKSFGGHSRPRILVFELNHKRYMIGFRACDFMFNNEGFGLMNMFRGGQPPEEIFKRKLYDQYGQRMSLGVQLICGGEANIREVKDLIDSGQFPSTGNMVPPVDGYIIAPAEVAVFYAKGMKLVEFRNDIMVLDLVDLSFIDKKYYRDGLASSYSVFYEGEDSLERKSA